MINGCFVWLHVHAIKSMCPNQSQLKIMSQNKPLFSVSHIFSGIVQDRGKRKAQLKMDPPYNSSFWHLLGWAGRAGHPCLPGPWYLVNLKYQSCGLLGRPLGNTLPRGRHLQNGQRDADHVPVTVVNSPGSNGSQQRQIPQTWVP